MVNRIRTAKINVKVLIILLVVVVGLGVSLVAARQIRRSILSERDFKAGNEAFAKGDWETAYKHLQEYLGRNPDDVEILKKYGQARLSVQPQEAPHVLQAVAAYRRVLQLVPADKIAYDKLGMLYPAIRNFEDLAYISRNRLEIDPNDREATLYLADALIRLNKLADAATTLKDFMRQCDPDEHAAEYGRACLKMSMVQSREDYVPAANVQDNEPNWPTTPLGWLNKAVDVAPNSAEVLVSRGHYYGQQARTGAPNADTLREQARADLEAASALDINDPRVCYALCKEWITHGQFDRAEVVLEAAERLPEETVKEYFLNARDWDVAKALLASELALVKGDTEAGQALADKTLETFTQEGYRFAVLPYAIQLYLAAGRVDVPDARDANDCLDEYLELQYTQNNSNASQVDTDYLQALVARAKGDSYGVIDIVQPLIAAGQSESRLWRLLADAFARTDQTRRAVDAMVNYLRLRPGDPEMTLQLAKEYLKLQDWNKAFNTARLAESLDPTDVVVQLLRMEASVYLAEQQQTLDKERLSGLAKELAQLRQDHPERVDIRILQAMIAVYDGRPDDAEAELKKAIEECDEPLRAEMQLASRYFRSQKMAEAVAVCQAACERHPEEAEPWLFLSSLHRANKDYDAALACLKDASAQVVGKWEQRAVSIQQAVFELLYGDEKKGIDLLRGIAEADKREIRARMLLLDTEAINSDQESAQNLIDELRAAEGETGLQWRLRQARLWLSSEDWRSKQQAIAEMLQYCITADPQWSTPYLLTVAMYEQLEDLQRAESICRQALGRNPGATDVADRLITLLEQQGRLEEAMEVADQAGADARRKSNLQIVGSLRSGEFSKAIEELELRVSNDTQDAQSRILLARLLYSQDKSSVEQAMAYLDEAEAITSGSLAITAARAGILRAEGRDEEARRILDDYVAREDDFDSHVLRAVYLFREGDIKGAEAEYVKLTADPNRGDAGTMLLGNFYAQNGRLDEAIAVLQEGCAKLAEGRLTSVRDPDGLAMKRGLMNALFFRGTAEDVAAAEALLTELEQRLPNDPELIKVRAMRLLTEYRQDPKPELLTTARTKFETVVRDEPTAVDAHRMLIGIAMQQGQYEAARDYAMRAIGVNPNNPDLLAAQAQVELALDNPRLALEVAQLALAEDPNQTVARRIILTVAATTRETGALETAVTLLDRELAADPANEQLLLSLAQMQVFLGQPAQAIPALLTYCQTAESKASVDAIVTLADLYRLTGEMASAGEWLDRAENIDATNSNVIHARILWLLAQERYTEVENLVGTYLSAPEQNAATLVKTAMTLAATNSAVLKQQAVALFKRALELSPGLFSARLGLASTLYQNGDVEGAKQLYQALLKEYPQHVQVLNDLAWILQESEQNYTEALELANRGLAIEPDNTNLLDTRGTILQNISGRLEEAQRDFRNLVRNQADGSRGKAKALLKLGRVCVQLGDRAGAKQHFSAALEIDQKLGVFTPQERAEMATVL